MNTMLGNTRRPDVTFHSDGRIDIASNAAQKLGIEPNDVIDIAYNGVEYYLYVKHRGSELVGRHQAQCHPTNKNKRYCHNYRAYSKRLCAAVMEICGITDAVRLPVGEVERQQGKRMLPIIIRNILQR